MRAFEITLAFALLSVVSLPAQQSAPALPMKDFASSADVAALIAQAKSEHKQEPLLSKPILMLAPINANLEYRTAVAPAALHETEAEIFYVIEGSGTMVTGGQLIGEKRLNAENLNGSGIKNGRSRRVAKGDFTIVPQGVPHWFSRIDGTLVLMSLHVPRKANR